MLNKLFRTRRFIRPTVLGLICLSAFVGWAISGCYVKVGYLRLICPAGFVEIVLTGHKIPWKLMPGFILLIGAIVFLGRLYCGWFCPSGYLGQQLNRFSPVKLPTLCHPVRPKKGGKRRFKLGLLDAGVLLGGLMLGMAVFQFPLMSLICPVGIISRNLISIFSVHEVRWDIALIFFLPTLALLFDFRDAPLCPLGILRAIVAHFGFSRPPQVERSACNTCQTCKTACPAGNNPLNPSLQTHNCIQCQECLVNCPQRALSFQINLKKTKTLNAN